MIKINERFTISSDTNNWVLIDSTPSQHIKSKTGISVKESYFNRPEQCFNEIINRTGKDAHLLTELIRDIYNIRDEIFTATHRIQK